MDEKKIVEGIKSLAYRLESGQSTIGDFLRAKVALPDPKDGVSGGITFDRGIFDAMAELSKSALRGYKHSDNTHGMLREQLREIYRGVLLGTIDEKFFARI